jgi:spore coat polysaccharide biosynthesis protein SpsF
VNDARIIAVVQARTGSTRLPGKVLADLGGAPVIDRVLARLGAAKSVDEVVVATTDLAGDDRLAAHVAAMGVPVVRGSSDDVLARYVAAAASHPAAAYVRVTADCPLLDPGVVDDVVRAFRATPPVEYCTNTLKRTFPLGMDVEVFSAEALALADALSRDPGEREHVTKAMYARPDRFRLRNVEAPAWARRTYRITVDEEADLALAREIVERLGAEATLRDIVALLDADPALAALNAHVAHREAERPESW